MPRRCCTWVGSHGQEKETRAGAEPLLRLGGRRRPRRSLRLAEQFRMNDAVTRGKGRVSGLRLGRPDELKHNTADETATAVFRNRPRHSMINHLFFSLPASDISWPYPSDHYGRTHIYHTYIQTYIQTYIRYSRTYIYGYNTALPSSKPTLIGSSFHRHDEMSLNTS